MNGCKKSWRHDQWFSAAAMISVLAAGTGLWAGCSSNANPTPGNFGGGSSGGGAGSGGSLGSGSGSNAGKGSGVGGSGGSGGGSGSSSASSSGGGTGVGAGSGGSSGFGGSGSSSGSAGSGHVSGSGSGGGGSGSGGSGSSSGASSGSTSSGSSSGGSSMGGCGQTLPALSDYSMNGPFTPMMTSSSTGPSSAYTVYQPSTLGSLNGAPFKHPIITWGNGITTTPATYPQWFNLMASNGFVVIASNSSTVTVQNMTDGLDWMVQQNSMSGPYQGVLDTTCLFTVGYSLGGQGSVTSGATHANVVATVGIHPAGGSPAGMKGPLLLFTSDTDTVCTNTSFVLPVFQQSPVQSFYADLTAAGDPSNVGHILPVVMPGLELSGTMAWLRLWAYGDQGGKDYFWGSSAKLCTAPWTCQSKTAGGTAQMSGF